MNNTEVNVATVWIAPVLVRHVAWGENAYPLPVAPVELHKRRQVPGVWQQKTVWDGEYLGPLWLATRLQRMGCVVPFAVFGRRGCLAYHGWCLGNNHVAIPTPHYGRVLQGTGDRLDCRKVIWAWRGIGTAGDSGRATRITVPNKLAKMTANALTSAAKQMRRDSPDIYVEAKIIAALRQVPVVERQGKQVTYYGTRASFISGDTWEHDEVEMTATDARLMNHVQSTEGENV